MTNKKSGLDIWEENITCISITMHVEDVRRYLPKLTDEEAMVVLEHAFGDSCERSGYIIESAFDAIQDAIAEIYPDMEIKHE